MVKSYFRQCKLLLLRDVLHAVTFAFVKYRTGKNCTTYSITRVGAKQLLFYLLGTLRNSDCNK